MQEKPENTSTKIATQNMLSLILEGDSLIFK